MTIIFNPKEYYNINKSVVICGSMPPEEPIGRIMDELTAFAASLDIHALKNTTEDILSGGLFHKKTNTRCHVLEIKFGGYTMRMLTSATIIGKIVSIYSYESFFPRPVSLELDYAGGPMVDAIAASLKRLEDVEFFFTMDKVFDFVHDHAVEMIRHCSLSTVHTTTVPLGRVA